MSHRSLHASDVNPKLPAPEPVRATTTAAAMADWTLPAMPVRVVVQYLDGNTRATLAWTTNQSA
jgi:hypothetical protein